MTKLSDPIGVFPKKLSSSFDMKQIEETVRRYWEQVDIGEQVRTALADRPLVGYVEGPPTMNGDPHIGHIRGRIMKDLWYRFSILRKKNLVFRAGWDCQGLPVELQAEKELGLTGSKFENLEKVGEEAIVSKCKEILLKYNKRWLDVDRLLGMSMDYDKAYWTYRDEYIEREWAYLKKAWEQKLLDEGYRVVAYCPSCQTSLSHTEIGQAYKMVQDPSLYFKVKLRDEDAYLLLWTTMPFTVVTDEMVGVHPDAEYVYVEIDNETWIVGATRIEQLLQELEIDDHHVIKTVPASELTGKHYFHPLTDLIPGQRRLGENQLVHQIVAEDFVDTMTGSGLVHMSPGNGEVDFEVATKLGMPIFSPIDDKAVFTEEAGEFSGLFVRDADQKVVEALKKQGSLVKIGSLTHEYPTCWRSHHKLVWLARREYFYWVDRLGDKALTAAQNVEYFYEPPRNRFLEIIKEKVPWCISRERVWGTPLPIWICQSCKDAIPAFSRAEIIQKALSLPDGQDFELHRPWIDRIELKCEKCGGIAKREPFVLDTWHNSGASPYAAFTDVEHSKLVPVDFLTEGIDQTRGWAYSLLIENVLLVGKAQAPYRKFLFQGHVLDAHGNKMSKSLGNMVDGFKALEENSVDALRFYFLWKSSPLENLNFSTKEVQSRPYQVLSTLYHLHVYFKQNSDYDAYTSDSNVEWALNHELLQPADRWLLSVLQTLIGVVEEGYAKCHFHEALRAIETFIIDHVSQTYVPFVRGEMWDDRQETKERRWAIYAVLRQALDTVDILLHPASPFLTEYLQKACFQREPSLLGSWPEVQARYADRAVEQDFVLISKLKSLSNAARMKAGSKRRWPLHEVVFAIEKTSDRDRMGLYLDLLKEQLNVKEVVFSKNLKGAPVRVKAEVHLGRVGPRVKGDMSLLLREVERMDGFELREQTRLGNSISIIAGRRKHIIDPSELSFTTAPEDGYAIIEKDGLVCLLNVQRDRNLIAEGLARDLARRLQSLRKEQGFNPTEILAKASVAGLDEEMIDLLSSQRSVLSQLVRVKEVVLAPRETASDKNWSQVELDGHVLQCLVE